jgi:MFS family permease
MNDQTQHRGSGYAALLQPKYRATSITSVMAVFIGSLDSLIIGAALPTITEQLHGAELYAAALGAYMIANLVGLPVFGATSDRTGPWRAFLMAAAVFGTGSLLGGFAPSMAVIVAARAVQGFGAGGLFAVGYAAIGLRLPQHLQPHGFGLLSATWGASALIGPAVGAAFIAAVGWRWVFWFNLPLVALILPVARSAFSGFDEKQEDAAPNNIRGPLLLGLIAGASLAAFSSPPAWVLPLSGIALVSLVVFIQQERRARRPVIGALRRPLSISAGAVMAACLTGVAFVVVQAYLPLFLQADRGASVLVAGAVLTCGSLSWSAGSIGAARLMRYGTRWLLTAGHLCFCAGTCLLIAAAALQLPVTMLFLGFIVTGLGVGFLTPSLFSMALAEASPGSEGSATAGVQVLRALGNGLGAGVAGLMFRLAVPERLFQLLGSADPASGIRSAGLAHFLDSALVHCWAASLIFIAVSAAVVLRLPGIRTTVASGASEAVV